MYTHTCIRTYIYIYTHIQPVAAAGRHAGGLRPRRALHGAGHRPRQGARPAAPPHTRYLQQSINY